MGYYFIHFLFLLVQFESSKHNHQPIMKKMFDFLKNSYISIRKYHENWLIKTPKQKWQSIYNFGDFVAKLVGVRVLSNMKFNWLTPACGLMFLDYLISVVYTIYYYFERKQYLKAIECTCIFGMVTVVSDL